MRTRQTSALASAVALVALGVAFAPGAGAHPGHPGSPIDDPVVLFHERFEQGLADGQLELLDVYKGGAYSADPAWLNQVAGNGLIVDGTTTNASLSAAGYPDGSGTGNNNLRGLATAIGAINGSAVANLNHAVTAYTDADPGANLVEFRIDSPLDLEAGGRFLTLSVNTAVVNCGRAANDPLLRFYLSDGGVETPTGPVINACGSHNADSAYASTLVGGQGVLFSGDQVGVLIRNEQGSGGGNDHAYDDVRVLDVTPQLDKEFVDPGPHDVETPVELVLTVTNTSELGRKAGWGFVDDLKDLEIVGPATHDCENADITAIEGDDVLTVENGSLAAGDAACSVVVPVTSDEDGEHENSADDVTLTGLNPPGSTVVEFIGPDDDDDDDSDDPAVPDTGSERASSWLAPASIAVGAAGLAGVGALAVTRLRRRS